MPTFGHRPRLVFDRVLGPALDRVDAAFAAVAPNAAALAAVAAAGAVVQPEAGAGWWAARLASSGGDVAALDPAPPASGALRWHAVSRGGPGDVRKRSDRALLLVGLDVDAAAAYLDAYAGDAVCGAGAAPLLDAIGARLAGWTEAARVDLDRVSWRPPEALVVWRHPEEED